MQLQKQSSSSKSQGACMALSASLSGRTSLEKAGTHESLVIKRHKVQGELVEYDKQRAMLASIKTTKSKTWTAAMCVKPDGSRISITFDILLPETGKQSTRSVDMWLHAEYCAEQYYHADEKEVPGTDATAVSDLLCGRLKLAAYLVELTKISGAIECRSFQQWDDENSYINENTL